MNIDLLNLPEDVDSLKNIIHFQVTSYEEIKRGHTDLECNHTTLHQRYTDLQKEYDFLAEQVQYFKSKLYDRKSEKSVYNQDQLNIFNEAEEIAAEENKAAEITVPSHTRKKGGQRPLPADFPREEVVHDLEETEKVCACGAPLSCIGEESSEKLDVMPAKVRIIKHIRIKYACKSLFRKVFDRWDSEQLLKVIDFLWMQRSYLDTQSPDLAELTTFLDRIDSENFEWFKLSSKYISIDFTSPFFIEYLDRFEDRESIRMVGTIFLEMFSTFTPDFDQEHIRSIIKKLYSLEDKTDANKICNIYGIRGNGFLRDIYDANINS